MYAFFVAAEAFNRLDEPHFHAVIVFGKKVYDYSPLGVRVMEYKENRSISFFDEKIVKGKEDYVHRVVGIISKKFK